MKRVIGILALLLLGSNLYGQTEQQAKTVKIYFDQDSYVIDSNVMQNNESLGELSDYIDRLKSDTLTTVNQINVDSYTSPEGGKSYNQKLSQRRSESIYNYLIDNKGLDASLITKQHSGTAWERLKELLRESSLSSKDELISIIDNTPEETWRRVNDSDPWLTMVDSRLKHLMDFDGGVPYKYMYTQIFPLLRTSSVVTVYTTTELPVVAAVVEEEVVEEFAVVAETVEVVEPTPEPTSVPVAVEDDIDRKLLLAIKTNLLYDLAFTPNIEVEVPFGERWSVNGEFARGWWLKEHTRCWQVQSAGIEGRYWFGDRSKRDQLTGWFAGLFANTGFCDFQFKDATGVQSDFYYIAGLSAGYSLPLSERFNMEFSAGAGYMVNEYQKYWVENNTTLIEDGPRMKMQSFLPAKVKVSLSWLIFRTKKK
ncbi:MAG: DUF3575 domain-containing protein [Rikenellaceae bacterium]